MKLPMGSIAILANPRAGKDIRRLVSESSPTSDSAKIGIVRRIISASLESGVERVLLMDDPTRLAQRAADGFGPRVDFLDLLMTGSSQDTIRAARLARELGISAVVCLGGDGTCRDVALGWPDVTLIPVSTGTNNIFPFPIDGTSAGTAAALLATGVIAADDVTRRAKRISVRIEDGDDSCDDLALVDLAIVNGDFIGARAVHDPTSITMIAAAIASPVGTGLSSIAGRIHPVDRWQPGGVLVTLGLGPTRLRVPLAPGSFSTVSVESVRVLTNGEPVTIHGRCILAFDGERDRSVSSSGSVRFVIEAFGPQLVDVHATLEGAARAGVFLTHDGALESVASHTATNEMSIECSRTGKVPIADVH